MVCSSAFVYQGKEGALKTVCILVADGQQMVRAGLCSLIETKTGWRTLETSNGREAVLKGTDLDPDVIVMGINVAEINVLDTVEHVHKKNPGIPIIVLSGYRSQALVDRALAAGVHGYLHKTDGAKDLLAAIEAVLQGKTFFLGIVSSQRVEHRPRTSGQDTAPRLTMREAEIVRLLCQGKSNKEVANELGISTRTVENHRARVMRKLGLKSFSDLLRYAIRNGLAEP